MKTKPSYHDIKARREEPPAEAVQFIEDLAKKIPGMWNALEVCRKARLFGEMVVYDGDEHEVAVVKFQSGFAKQATLVKQVGAMVLKAPFRFVQKFTLLNQDVDWGKKDER